MPDFDYRSNISWMLRPATPNQSKEIYSHFQVNKAWFPHIRKDYVERMVRSGNVIYQDGVIIIYKRYQRRQKIGDGRNYAQKGDVMLHQILNVTQGSGLAGSTLKTFFKEMASPVWLTVRAENNRAINFYLKNGMNEVGTTSWMKGKMPGLVFRYDP